MRLNNFINKLVVGVTLGVGLLGGMWGAEAASTVRVGTGSTNGVYFPTGSAICRVMKKSRDQHNIRCSVRSTAGSMENLGDLLLNKLQFAFVQNDLQEEAYNNGETKLNTVFTLYTDVYTVVSRSNSGIREFNQLQGKRVSIGETGSGQRRVTEKLMQTLGWTASSFGEMLELPTSQQVIQLCDNDIDAFIYVAGQPNLSTQTASQTCSIHLAHVRGSEVDKFVASSPMYQRVQIPQGIYPDQKSDIVTFGTRTSLVTRNDVPEDEVYLLVKAVFENFTEFTQTHPVLKALTPQDMLKDNPTPHHPGALRYYRERGWM